MFLHRPQLTGTVGIVRMSLQLLLRPGPARGRVLGLSKVLMAFGLSLAVARAEATDVALFLASYRQAVKQQSAVRSSFEVEAVLTEEGRQSPKIAQSKRLVHELVYARNPAHEKYQSHFTEGLKPGVPQHEIRLVVQGADRNFWLYKPDPRSEFALTHLESPSATSTDVINRQRNFLIDAWSHLGTYSVIKLLDSPGFRIERVEPESDLIGIDFSFRPEDPKKPLMAGHFVVDPAQGMAIRRQDVRRWAPATPDRISTVRGEATYRMVDGVALPDEVDLQIGTPAEPAKDHMHLRVTRTSTAPIPDSAFALAAFEVGDLDRPAPRSRFDFAYWAIGLAGVAFALSVFLKWRGRNSARASDRAVGVAG